MVSLTFEEGGTYTGITLDTYDSPPAIEFTNLSENVTISINVDEIPSEEYNPECFYDINIDKTDDYKWSSEGCFLDSINRAQNTIVCKCNHLSRFTAGEGLEYVPPLAPIIKRVIVTVPEDDLESDLFPINAGLYVIVMTIMLVTYR